MKGQDQTIEKCSRCHSEVVPGINAVKEDENLVCETCANVKHGYANTLLPHERAALRETLQADIQLSTNPYHTSLLAKALEDAQ